MTIERTSLLDKKLQRIHRGAYWFGIIGRLSLLIGGLYFLSALGLLLMGAGKDFHAEMYHQMISSLVGSLTPLLTGWMFLLGRDAFEAIEALIVEVGEIV